MTQQPFFSVVMPIYNVENFLSTAIDSVLNQTFKDFEIILVNDCSTDGSATICEEYAQNHSNITYVTYEKNRGPGGARNTGFQKAKGKYVWFFDSDDIVEIDLFDKIYASLLNNPADAVIFGFVEDYYDKSGALAKTVEMCPEKAICKTEKELQSKIMYLENNTYYGYPWNKFYSIEHIRENNLIFENIVLIEDIKFNIMFFENAKSLNILDITPYRYAKRGTDSITAKFVPDYYKVHRERINLLFTQQKGWGILTDDTRKELGNIYTRYIFSALSRNCDKRAKMTHKNRKQFLNDIFADPLFNELIPYSGAQSRSLKIMTTLLKKRNTAMALTLGRVIYIIQNKANILFVKLKQARK